MLVTIFCRSLSGTASFAYAACEWGRWPHLLYLPLRGEFALEAGSSIAIHYFGIIAWGVGGLASPLVGMVADRIGIERTLMLISFTPLVAAALALPLPAARTTHITARASDVATVESTGTDVAP